MYMKKGRSNIFVLEKKISCIQRPVAFYDWLFPNTASNLDFLPYSGSLYKNRKAGSPYILRQRRHHSPKQDCPTLGPRSQAPPRGSSTANCLTPDNLYPIARIFKAENLQPPTAPSAEPHAPALPSHRQHRARPAASAITVLWLKQ